MGLSELEVCQNRTDRFKSALVYGGTARSGFARLGPVKRQQPGRPHSQLVCSQKAHAGPPRQNVAGGVQKISTSILALAAGKCSRKLGGGGAELQLCESRLFMMWPPLQPFRFNSGQRLADTHGLHGCRITNWGVDPAGKVM